jgi:hypothetical protein
MRIIDRLKGTVERGRTRMKERGRDAVLGNRFAEDPDVDLVVKTAVLESLTALPARFGPGLLAATVLRHPILRDALDAPTRARLRDELLASRRPGRTSLALRAARTTFAELRRTDESAPVAFGAISGVHWASKTSFRSLLDTLASDHAALRDALASVDLARAILPYRAVIDASRVIPLRGDDVATTCEVHAVREGDETTPPTAVAALREAFDLSEPDAFFAMLATDAHGSALVATMPRPEAEERIFAATRLLRPTGHTLAFRMLRVGS